uniref:Uncharacterized protein n=1 Tax=Rhizophora mucronata TaxID=61149 RepID=A0A2P2LT82_RHIMU
MEKPILDPVISAQINEIKTSETEIEVCRSIKNEMQTAINSLLKVML